MDSAREIENLLYTYADRIDAGDFAGVGALFAHGSFFGVAGADAVRTLYEQTTRRHPVDGVDGAGTPLTQHLVSNVTVDLDDAAGTASARSRFQVLQATPTLPLQPIVAGRYRDTFHRVDGTWWFHTREADVVLVGDVSQHLLPGTLG